MLNWARFVQIAMGSASELDYHLLLASDLGLFGTENCAANCADLEEVMRMLAALSSASRLREAASGFGAKS